ncbi:MAG: hypothetical protein Q7K57_01565 [Burkholderiaceae bacterium]|nr:hypothetical protein [Burkholderiaceae bacterium]
MKLSFHGAGRGFTGSCHLVECAGKCVLIDCGLFQGGRGWNFHFDSKFAVCEVGGVHTIARNPLLGKNPQIFNGGDHGHELVSLNDSMFFRCSFDVPTARGVGGKLVAFHRSGAPVKKASRSSP